MLKILSKCKWVMAGLRSSVSKMVKRVQWLKVLTCGALRRTRRERTWKCCGVEPASKQKARQNNACMAEMKMRLNAEP